MNTNITALASAARIASGASELLRNDEASAAAVVVDITAISGTTPTLTVIVEALDAASGKYVTLIQSTALAAVGTTLLRVGPGLTAAANLTVNGIVPRLFRVRYTIAGTAPSVTFSVGAALVK